jgi:hypothetical protein
MRLPARLSTLAKADAHGVVDALEDKALVLRQQVREAAAELDRKRWPARPCSAQASPSGPSSWSRASSSWSAACASGRRTSLRSTPSCGLASGRWR